MSDLYLEAAAKKAEEQHEWAGTSQLGWDNYVRNILHAYEGDRELLERVKYVEAVGRFVGHLPDDEVLVRVSVTEGKPDKCSHGFTVPHKMWWVGTWRHCDGGEPT